MSRGYPQIRTWRQLHTMSYAADMEDHRYDPAASIDTVPSARQALNTRLSGLPCQHHAPPIPWDAGYLLWMPSRRLSRDFESESRYRRVLNRMRALSSRQRVLLGNGFRSFAHEVSADRSPSCCSVQGVPCEYSILRTFDELRRLSRDSFFKRRESESCDSRFQPSMPDVPQHHFVAAGDV